MVFIVFCSCVEWIIEEQLRKMKETLEDIDQLDSYTVTANEKLNNIRLSKRISSMSKVRNNRMVHSLHNGGFYDYMFFVIIFVYSLSGRCPEYFTTCGNGY